MATKNEGAAATPVYSTLVSNERIKLLANAFNTAATSSFALGVLAPIAAAIYYVAGPHMKLRIILVGVIVWLSTAGRLRT